MSWGVLGNLSVLYPVFGIETPAQETATLFWFIFLLALSVGIVYVFLLLWTLSRHISHEPLARTRNVRPPPPRPSTKGH